MGIFSSWKQFKKKKNPRRFAETDEQLEREHEAPIPRMNFVRKTEKEREESKWKPSIPKNQAVELGTINYVNLPPPGRHGSLELALEESAKAPENPLFVNFVEWSG
mmetsp:Transcript_20447/g.24772  ORF Transcript_20447/g.24772 Transcript_20447/m.24772 type:complete len:106 (-) Transcript_20447:1839-2156(-)